MDFIEQLFGLSPDNGDGTTEILWLAVLAILLGLGLYWRRHRLRPLRSRAALQRRLGLEETRSVQAAFTCLSRTRVGDQEAVIVIGDANAPDTASLIGAIVRIDGIDHVVYDVSATETPIRPGKPLMMRVRKLREDG